MSGGPSDHDRAWAAGRKAAVAAAAADFVARHAVDAAQRALLERALTSLRARRMEPPLAPSVHLPLLVFGALAGDDTPAVPLATATALLELGIDLLDHAVDNEPDAQWAGQPPALALLAATGFLCAVPQLALAELDAPDGTRADLQRELAQGLFAIGAGEQRDLMLSAGACPDLDAVEAAVGGKTGERRALFARLAARLAGASVREAEGFASMARHFGMALQWASDLADAVASEGGRDLAAGTPTLPVVLWLRAQPDAAQAWARVRAARHDAAARSSLRAALFSGGALRGCQLKIEGERAQARRALAGLPAREPFRSRLDLWLAGGW